MNTNMSLNRFSLLLSAAVALAGCMFWWAAESRAEAAPVAADDPSARPSVQDRAPTIDLDTKIFLHRNAQRRASAPVARA